uniref:Uncharacterized protein n=1 Tax=Kalanchoe fedtschenkoi TaxID=63787 RepID=A0A7N0UX15_KALFE
MSPVDATPTLVSKPLQLVDSEKMMLVITNEDAKVNTKEEDWGIEKKCVLLVVDKLLSNPQYSDSSVDKMDEYVEVWSLPSHVLRYALRLCTLGVCKDAQVDISFQFASSLSLCCSSYNLVGFESVDCIDNGLDRPPPLPPEMDSFITLRERLDKFKILDEYGIAGCGLGGGQSELAMFGQPISMILPSMMVWQPSNPGMKTLEKFCTPTVWVDGSLSFPWYFVIFFNCSSNQHYFEKFEQAGLRHNGTKRPPPLPPKAVQNECYVGAPCSGFLGFHSSGKVEVRQVLMAIKPTMRSNRYMQFMKTGLNNIISEGSCYVACKLVEFSWMLFLKTKWLKRRLHLKTITEGFKRHGATCLRYFHV